MKKLLLCTGMLCLFSISVFSAPNTLVGIHKGDLDGFQEITVTSTTPSVLISTGSSVGYIYTDYLIKNYGSYDVMISTDPAIPSGARYRLEVGESFSPQGIIKNKAVFGKCTAGNSSSTVYTIKTKYSE